MQKIAENVYQINGAWGSAEILGGNVFLLADDKLTVIDTGFKGSARYIFKAARDLGYSPSDIANIIITHHHPDHIFGLAPLKTVTPAKVLVHREDTPYVTGLLPQPGVIRSAWYGFLVNPWRGLWSTMPVPVDVKLNDGDEIPVLGGIKIIHTPGHTPGSIIVYLEKYKLLIVGDLLVHGENLYLPSRAFTVDKQAEFNSIQKVTHIDFDMVGFGHGPPILADAHSQVQAFAEELRYKYSSSNQKAFHLTV
jgi:glyoxylase-like metal-dependent hydrolase (beta-lactamase superfamily II)